MKKKRSSVGCLFWIALILLVVVVFLFNRERIKNVLESTGFTNFLSREKEKEPEIVRDSDSSEDAVEPEKREKTTIIEIQPADENGLSIDTEDTGAVETVGTVGAVSEDAKPGDRESGVADEERWKIRNGKLYFIDVDDNGAVSLRAVTRPIKFRDSPLTETMKELLGGLLPSELNMELLTLIPEKTELLSIRVNNKIAYMNFNEAFRFNSLGLEGYIAQLKQIVYTATEFSTVDSVQILINGKTYDYLGPEGVFIGQPLSRSSFH